MGRFASYDIPASYCYNRFCEEPIRKMNQVTIFLCIYFCFSNASVNAIKCWDCHKAFKGQNIGLTPKDIVKGRVPSHKCIFLDHDCTGSMSHCLRITFKNGEHTKTIMGSCPIFENPVDGCSPLKEFIKKEPEILDSHKKYKDKINAADSGTVCLCSDKDFCNAANSRNFHFGTLIMVVAFGYLSLGYWR